MNNPHDQLAKTLKTKTLHQEGGSSDKKNLSFESAFSYPSKGEDPRSYGVVSKRAAERKGGVEEDTINSGTK